MTSPHAVRHLLLLRHAKSAWIDPALGDRDRPLAERGIAAASAMGRFIAVAGLTPDRILCSPALRAQQTCELVTRELPWPPSLRTVEHLYDFGDGSAVLDIIRSTGGSEGHLLLVGHNPAFENAARRLVRSGDAKLRKRLDKKFPTAALAVIAFELDRWSEIAEASGELIRFVRPRDLPAE